MPSLAVFHNSILRFILAKAHIRLGSAATVAQHETAATNKAAHLGRGAHQHGERGTRTSAPQQTGFFMTTTPMSVDVIGAANRSMGNRQAFNLVL
ncbi:hypothetical protein [Trinickia mobilis]|uniref:hypothetical protein n=1 Tax=Trinickia mobilis TaxID=2816356 RepID=UPI001A908AED|nr:hypothetical protein [Trinickia mobilis]